MFLMKNPVILTTNSIFRIYILAKIHNIFLCTTNGLGSVCSSSRFALFFMKKFALFCLSLLLVGQVSGQTSVQEVLSDLNERIGQCIDQDNAFGCQCVDVAKYVCETYYNRPISGNANQLDAVSKWPTGTIKINYYAGFIPQPGDFYIWDTFGVNGHIGMIESATATTYTSLDENFIRPSGNGSPLARVPHPNYNHFTCIMRLPYLSNAYLNQALNIYGGKVSAPKNLDLYIDNASFTYTFRTSNVSNIKIKDGSTIYTIPTSRITAQEPKQIGNKFWQHITLSLRASDIAGLTNSHSMRTISFDLNDGGTTLKYENKNLYFMDIDDPNATFTDINGLNIWSSAYIRKGAGLGLFRGTSLETFKPTDNLTRGQAASVLISAAVRLGLCNIDISTNNGSFTDVDASNPFFGAIQTMRNYGFSAANTTFSPNENITVGQFCQFIRNVFNIQASDGTPTNYQNVLKRKIIAQSNNAALTDAMNAVLRLVDIRQETAGFWVTENVWDFKDYSDVNSPILSPITIDGSKTLNRAVMAKVLTNLTIWKAKKLGITINFRGEVGSPNLRESVEPTIDDMVGIGEKYDNTATPTGNAPPRIAQVAFTCVSGGTLAISYPSDYDNSGNPQHFYWSMQKNGADLASTTATHRSINFIAPTVTQATEWKLYSYVANNKGKSQEVYITITVNPPVIVTPTKPSIQAANLQITGQSTNSIALQWQRGNGQSCIVVAQEVGVNPIDQPQANTLVSSSSNFANAPSVFSGSDTKVVYTGAGNTLNVTGLAANTSYRFAVYEYNGTSATNVLYKLENAATGTGTTTQFASVNANFTFSTNQVVPNQAVTLTNTTTNANTFNWSVTPTATISNPTSATTTTVSFPSSGSYTVRLDATNSTTGVRSYAKNSIYVSSPNDLIPDLVPINPIVTPTNVSANSNITVSLTVANSGADFPNSSATFIRYYLSQDQIFDANDYYFASNEYQVPNSIAGSGSVNIPIQTLPIGSQTIYFNNGPGQYYILIIVDGTNLIAESNENNNMLAIPINIQAALPNPYVQSVSVPSSAVQSGQSFSVTTTLNNSGFTDCNITRIDYYLSTDNVLSPDDINLGLESPNSLYVYPNRAESYSTSVSVPMTTANGNYYLFVGGILNVNDSDPSNNFKSTNITVNNPNQPTLNAINFSISNITENSMRVSWTRGNGSNCIVIGSPNHYFPAITVDNKNYMANANYTLAPYVYYQNFNSDRNSRVLYDGTGNYVDVTGLTSNQTYTFTVLEYNGTGTSKDYLQVPASSRGIAAHTLYTNNSAFLTKAGGLETVIPNIKFFNQNTGFLFKGYFGAAVTSDGGNTWTCKTNSLLDKESYLYDFWLNNTGIGWMGNEKGKIFKTIDFGNIWALQNTPVNRQIRDIYFVDANIGYACCSFVSGSSSINDGAILKTTNGGNTWAVIQNTSKAISSIFFINAQTGWASTWSSSNNSILDKIILKTTNGGNNWTSVIVNTPSCTQEVADIYFIDSQKGFAINMCGKLLTTNNGGSSWSVNDLFSGGNSFSKISFIDNMIGYITWGNRQLAKTTDGGLTWSIITIQNDAAQGNAAAISVVSANNIWVSGLNGVLNTTTSGQAQYIALAPLSNTTYCQGSTFSNSYTLVGTFNTGNAFTLELSDANGSFNTTAELATVSSIANGTLSGAIPTNIAAGSGYRVRVMSSNPVAIGAESAAFSIAAPPSVNITNLATNYLSTVAPITLTGTPTGGTFKINGTTATQFNPSTLGNGTHTVTYEVTQGSCTASARQFVTIAVPISATASVANTSVCAGTPLSVTYNISGVFDANNVFTVELSNETGSFATPTVIGIFSNIGNGTLPCILPQNLIGGNQYRVRVVASTPSFVGTSSGVFTLQSTPLVAVTMNVIPSNNICGNDAVIFAASPTNGGTTPQYQWKLNGANVSTNSFRYQTTALKDGDVVYVEMVSNAVCATSTPSVSTPVNMIITTIEKPVIFAIDSILASSATTGNQWYKNGVAIQGETNQYYTTNQRGFYTVTITRNGCSNTSDIFQYNPTTDTKEFSTIEQQIKVFPNPTFGQVTVELKDLPLENTEIHIFNTLGQFIAKKKAENEQVILDFSNLAAGIYYLKVKTMKGEATKKVILQK